MLKKYYFKMLLSSPKLLGSSPNLAGYLSHVRIKFSVTVMTWSVNSTVLIIELIQLVE